ncbi:MAG: hypothetical protein A2672_01030 [Candidatus Wildermuthbacteria bacterium RIFCSPHIGHO2_01_FULL_49_22b]|uniref:AMP-dependent synthetase/ligase domain-containing protein n=1 Tax=Candidatus Wildermuthbacteria bacterium RIFCSPHIGHO2_01_FULL_49_22b TaxID=1802448 RepID=A0A1G2QVA3_9BACT|nr:MAG: hypothetical protein A2672_01030 [Candidatus Wildermuthbacteria bacterium RIFCSPHIGHO2_01_FULL_49_22b]
MILHEHFSNLAAAHPSKEALLSYDEQGEQEESFTFAELKRSVERIAGWLNKDLGLRPGDVLALALPNSVELLIISWAAWASDIITLPLDTKRDTARQCAYKVQLAKAKVLIGREEMLSSLDSEELRKACKVVEVSDVQKLQDAAEEPSWQQGTSHAALILFTSGTTAEPKGAELTLQNLLVNAEGIKDWLKIEERDRFCVLLPLHHINSTTFCLAALLAGTSIAVPPSYSNSRFWQCLAKTKSTFTSIVPTICYDQLSRGKEFAQAKEELKLTRIQIGSAPVVAADAQKFMDQFGIPLYQGYGQTETALRVTGVPMGLPPEIYEQLVEENSIGKAMEWADVRILKKEGGFAAEGQEGEIAVKGPAVMKGYLENPEANEKAFKNGYFLTGDLGFYKTIAGARYFFLKGRIKEIIIKGGVNLSPAAIESRLKTMCQDIEQVYVMGMPDARYGEEVAAAVCFNKQENPSRQLALLKYKLSLPSKEFPLFERPKYLAVIEADQVPMTPTGKVQRSALKNILPSGAFEQVSLVAQNSAFAFFVLSADDKRHFKQALELFNFCWQPLTIDEQKFAAHVRNGTVIIAVDAADAVCGLVSFVRTLRTQEQLVRLTYRELTSDLSLQSNEPEGDKIVCVSVCSNTAQEQPLRKDITPPSPSREDMEAYLRSGNDMVYNFHQKPKAALPGAELIALLPQARPEDTLALGYAMLLRYPQIPETKEIEPDAASSCAVQLVEAAMRFAQQLGVSRVYAFSRPAGAYHYFMKKQ